MIHISDKRNCVGCANCVQVCPVKCIEFKSDAEGFMYPFANINNCIDCGRCNQVCPVERRYDNAEQLATIKAFGAVNKDLNVRMASSSGGIFSALAIRVLNDNGIVFGASDIGNAKVKHIAIRDKKDLYKIQRSKYVQSDLMGVFPLIDTELDNGVFVLFSGTPCQIKALYTFLDRRPKNLLTVEVVCHGVPSPMILERYLQELGADNMIFRKKERSWGDYDVEIHYSDGYAKTEKASQNLYMIGFLQNWYLRPSCSQCPSKSFSSGADITLGDFWGGQRLAPRLFDDRGTSIVFLHSHLGLNVWNSINDLLDYIEVPADDAKKENPCICESVVFPSDRRHFFNSLNSDSLLSVLKKYTYKKTPPCKRFQILITSLLRGVRSCGSYIKRGYDSFSSHQNYDN